MSFFFISLFLNKFIYYTSNIIFYLHTHTQVLTFFFILKNNHNLFQHTFYFFQGDRRMNEVIRLLTSNKPNRIIVIRQPEDSDHDVETRKQSQLELECRRSTALPLARGMLTLSVDSPERLMHEVLPMPTISLLGRVPPSTATLQLDLTTNGLPPTYLDWVRFHNGVAAGLRCAPRVDNDQISPASITTARDQETQDEFTRTWISYNRLKSSGKTGTGGGGGGGGGGGTTSSDGVASGGKGTGIGTPEHAGFLLAMGLQG